MKSDEKENDLRLAILLVSGLLPQNMTWFSSVKLVNIYTMKPVDPGLAEFSHCYYADGMWVACGCDSLRYRDSGGNDHGIWYSLDGKTFERCNQKITEGLASLYYFNGIWIGAPQYTDYYYMYSEDGKNWLNSNKHTGYSSTIVSGNNICVLGASDGLYYSTNGKSWTKSNISSSEWSTSVERQLICFGDGVFVANNDWGKGLLYSADGKTWTQSNITSGNYNVAYSSELEIYLASPDFNGYCNAHKSGIYYSTDGKTWTMGRQTTGAYGFCCANNMIVAGAIYDHNGGLMYSTDGKTWTQSNVTTGYFQAGGSIRFGNGIWLAVSTRNTNKAWWSNDGKFWNLLGSVSTRALEYANGLFLFPSDYKLYAVDVS